MDITITEPSNPSDAAAVIHVLRSALSIDTVATRIQQAELRTAIAYRGTTPLGAVSFNVISDVHWHRTMFIHDLVTLPNERGGGVGAKLLAFVAECARQADCNCLRLCSGLERADAHRFYLANGFDKSSVQFVMHL